MFLQGKEEEAKEICRKIANQNGNQINESIWRKAAVRSYTEVNVLSIHLGHRGVTMGANGGHNSPGAESLWGRGITAGGAE